MYIVGNTTLFRLIKIPASEGSVGTIYAKMESQNPISSVNYRIGRSMILEAKMVGEITPGNIMIVKPTSGNTGIPLAFIASSRGTSCF